MAHLIEFLVGQQYENRKGVFKVLVVEGDEMRIRWGSGEEIDTTVMLQSHIIERMQSESDRTSQDKGSFQLRD